MIIYLKKDTPKKNSHSFSLDEALELLGGEPEKTELERLIRSYPTEKWGYRSELLYGFFEGKDYKELTKEKIKVKKLPQDLPPQSQGGHTKWAISKSKKMVIRLLYLRLTKDEGYTQKEANSKLLEIIFPNMKVSDFDSCQSSIRKITSQTKYLQP